MGVSSVRLVPGMPSAPIQPQPRLHAHDERTNASAPMPDEAWRTAETRRSAGARRAASRMMNPAGNTAGALIVAATHAQQHAEQRPVRDRRDREPGDDEADHQRVVVTAADEVEQHERVAHAEPHGARRILARGLRQLRAAQIAMSTTPATSNRRRIMIVVTTLPPESRTAKFARRRKSGPYGDGVVSQA